MLHFNFCVIFHQHEGMKKVHTQILQYDEKEHIQLKSPVNPFDSQRKSN